MPYHIKKQGKKFKIVRDEDGVVVGTSDSKAKALRSIGYREDAIMRKERMSKKHGTKKVIKIL